MKPILMGLVALALAGVLRPLTVNDVEAQVASPQPPANAPKYDIVMDTTQSPDLKAWADKLRPEIEKWYPLIVQYLPSDGYTAPRKFTITFKKMNGVAYTSGTDVVCAEQWFKAHPDDQGAVIHELVHVVQQYRSRGNPGWLVEGIADYIRWFKYEPRTKRPRPSPTRAHYNDGYRTTAAFLEFVATKYDHEIALRMNEAMREGRYKTDLWKDYTGKTPEDLWAEYVKTLANSAETSR